MAPDHDSEISNRRSDKGLRPYSRPKLTEFGSLHRVTRGTGGGGTDVAGPMTKKSDRSLKENIVRVDTHPLGFGLYLFDFKPEHRAACGLGRHFGVMADEVELVVPDAVSIGPAGYKLVDYSMLEIRNTLSNMR